MTNPNTRISNELPLDLEILVETKENNFENVEPKDDKLVLEYIAESNLNVNPELKMRINKTQN